MITKINAHKINYQPNIKSFVWKCDNFIKNKLKQIIKLGFQSNQVNQIIWFGS
jgi:hypothetical protein